MLVTIGYKSLYKMFTFWLLVMAPSVDQNRPVIKGISNPKINSQAGLGPLEKMSSQCPVAIVTVQDGECLESYPV